MKIPARIKAQPEDFRVDEVALYEPQGTGDHLYVTFEKRGLSTFDAVRMLGTHLGANSRDIGVAGMKDKWAVTTQTVSVPCHPKDDTMADKALGFSTEGLRVLGAKRHGNKLKTGHLAGNRFGIVLRDVPLDRVDEALTQLERAGQQGVPNAFGEQRFGRDKDNADRALSWLRGENPGPRDGKLKRLLISALQARVFNEVLEARVVSGNAHRALEGDVMQVVASGGLFYCTDAQADQLRIEAGEICPTGPMPGPKMKLPQGKVLELEKDVERSVVGPGFDWSRAGNLAEGTRRALWLAVAALSARRGEEPGAIAVEFVLPKGAYATTVLSEVFDTSEARPGGPSAPADDSETLDS